MTQEDKQLLLQDLCARLPYGVKIEITWWVADEGTCMNTTLEPDHIDQLLNDDDTEIKPYLHPLSSMTEEEKEEFENFVFPSEEDENGNYQTGVLEKDIPNYINWLNKKMFDFRGLIPRGRAIEVTKNDNPYKY